MNHLSDRALTGAAAVGAGAVVLISKVWDITFTDAEYGVLVAAGGVLTAFVASVIRHYIGMEGGDKE